MSYHQYYKLSGVRMSNFEHLEKGQKTITSLIKHKQEYDEQKKDEVCCAVHLDICMYYVYYLRTISNLNVEVG